MLGNAGKVPTLFWFDRFDERVGLLPVAGELVHTEELNGQDTLEFSTPEVVQKGDRILWYDEGEWREHVVVRTDQTAPLMTEVYAESSLCEMLDDFIEEEHLVSRTALQALGYALAPTRWEVECCDVQAVAGCVLYHVNALWALRKVAEVWGGELTPKMHVVNQRVAARTIRFEREHGR